MKKLLWMLLVVCCISCSIDTTLKVISTTYIGKVVSVRQLQGTTFVSPRTEITTDKAVVICEVIGYVPIGVKVYLLNIKGWFLPQVTFDTNNGRLYSIY